MKRKQLSNKEIKQINDGLESSFSQNDFFSKKDNLELVDDRFLMKDGKPAFFYHEKKFLPALHTLLKNNFLPKIVIDMPAVKFIANGADVMRPGIIELENFEKGEIVSVVDEKNRKPLAIGEALFGSEEMKRLDKGKAVKVIHYVGDEIWNSFSGS